MATEGIRIWPESGSEIDVFLQKKYEEGWTFSGIGFFAGNLGFHGWMLATAPEGEQWVQVTVSGREEAKFTIQHSDPGPDPCDLAREYAEHMEFANQPTSYDP